MLYNYNHEVILPQVVKSGAEDTQASRRGSRTRMLQSKTRTLNERERE